MNKLNKEQLAQLYTNALKNNSNSNTIFDGYYTCNEIAEKYKVPLFTIYQWVFKGKFISYKKFDDRRVIKINDFIEFKNNRIKNNKWKY